ncbi:MAG: signal peptidase II [Planctomycetes bacterium]|nr:signal peptidase II [Planctomycetota bacterium]
MSPAAAPKPWVRWALFLVALAVGLALDLVSKHKAFEALPGPGSTTVLIEGWFNFTHATNRGAAFGLFEGRHTLFMIMTVLAFVGVPYFVHTAPARAWGLVTTLGLILAGVIGNFWDRVVYGFVRDFLDVHTPNSGSVHDLCQSVFGSTVWPTFNVADVFITTGAVAMIFLWGDGKPKPAPAPSGEPSAAPESADAVAKP